MAATSLRNFWWISIDSADAAIDIQIQHPAQRAQTLGDHVPARLAAMKSRRPLMGAIRGRGLLVGTALAKDQRVPSVEGADFVMYECLKHGLAFRASDGHFLTLTPPLTIELGNLRLFMILLEATLSAAEKRHHRFCDPSGYHPRLLGAGEGAMTRKLKS